MVTMTSSRFKGVEVVRKVKTKYKNKPVLVDGIWFQSIKEAKRWKELQLLEKAGVISGLTRQQAFTVLPNQKIGGKVVERAVKYVADFCYYKDGEYIVEDTKGFRTADYIIKRKLMLYTQGIHIKEV